MVDHQNNKPLMDDMRDVVGTPFLGRSRDLRLHVIGLYEHFASSMVPKILDILGIGYGPALSVGEAPVGSAHAYINWYNREITPPPDDLRARLDAHGVRILNASGFSHVKSYSDTCFSNVFGYKLDIDPLTYDGLGVVKGQHDNGRKSARHQMYPLDVTDPYNFAYQRLIRNEVHLPNGRYSYDLRVPVFDGEVPLVTGQVYELDRRFAYYADQAGLLSPHDVFTIAELDLIRRYCAEIRLDYGELDVLRCLIDGRIYIVDANATPWGPVKALSPDDKQHYLREMATAAVRCFWRRTKD